MATISLLKTVIQNFGKFLLILTKKHLSNLLQDTLHAHVEIIDNYPGILNNVIHSQPTDSLLKPMMHRSDNFYAEQSLLMVSEKLLGTMNDRKIIDTLLKSDYKD